jgi:membrane fusion protein (multidrug efflux system)
MLIIMKSPSPVRIITIAIALGLLAAAASEWQTISNFAKTISGAQSPASAQSGKPGGFGGGMPPLPVEVLNLNPQYVEEQLNAVGTIEASASALIRPEISGRLISVFFQEGKEVQAGTILARLADEELKAARDEAKANYDLSVITYKRAQVLGKQGIASAQTRDEAEAKMHQAQALLAKAEAILEKTILRAPFAGVVGLREIDEGAFVEAGAMLTHLESLNPVNAEFDVPERDLANVAVGQKIAVRVEALPQERFLGIITAIAPRLEKETRAARVKATIDNGANLLRPGMFAYLSVNIRTIADALMVPEEAIIHRGEQTMICVIKDGKAHFVSVTLGIRRAREVQIAKGLGAGEVVVTAGHMKLQEGAAVMVMNAKAPDPALAPAVSSSPEKSAPDAEKSAPIPEPTTEPVSATNPAAESPTSATDITTEPADSLSPLEKTNGAEDEKTSSEKIDEPDVAP